MATARRGQHRRDVVQSQSPIRQLVDAEERDAGLYARVESLAIDPQRDARLITARELLKAWGLSNRALRSAVITGLIRRVRRAGHQPFYVYEDVRKVLGEPEGLNSVNGRESEKGPYQQPFEFAAPLAA